MSTTESMAISLPSATDVAVKLLDQSKLEFKGSTVTANSISSTYVYADGSGGPSKTTVVLKSIVDANKDVIIQSVELSTERTVTTDSVVVSQAPFIVKMQWTSSMRFFDAALVMSWLGAAWSLTFPTLATKVPTTGTLGKFNDDLLQDVF